MSKYNLDNFLVKDLKNKIEIYNSETKKIIGAVAKRQKWTVLLITFATAIFYIFSQHFQSTKYIFGVDSTIIFLLLNILYAFFPFPNAISYGEKKLSEVSLQNRIESIYSYNGQWSYKTIYSVKSEDDGSKEYKILSSNMNGYKEDGLCNIVQDNYLIKSIQGKTRFWENDYNQIEKPRVDWEAIFVSISESSIEWYFEGNINWKGSETYSNTFSGIQTNRVETFNYKKCPSKIAGDLNGYVHMGTHCYLLSARMELNRV